MAYMVPWSPAPWSMEPWPRYDGTMVPWYHGTMVPWYHGTMVPWYHGTMVPWYHGAMVPWYHGTMVPWYHGTMVPWYHGTMVPWYQVAERTRKRNWTQEPRDGEASFHRIAVAKHVHFRRSKREKTMQPSLVARYLAPRPWPQFKNRALAMQH